MQQYLRSRGRDRRSLLNNPAIRAALMVVAGLVGGFVAGLVISEVVGVVGYLGFGQAVGVRFLPFYLGAFGAIALPVFDAWSRRDTREGG